MKKPFFFSGVMASYLYALKPHMYAFKKIEKARQ